MVVTTLDAASPRSEGPSWDPIGDYQRQIRHREVAMPAPEEGFVSRPNIEVEVEYTQRTIPIAESTFLRIVRPLVLRYSGQSDQIEVEGWGISVGWDGIQELPRRIGRRFLDLFSRSQIGTLTEQEEACLQAACRHVDYFDFVASRSLPRYMEATLVRKSPKLLVQFLEDRNVALPVRLATDLDVLDEGDRFGAYFTLDRDENVIGLRNVILLPPTGPSD